MKNLDLNNYGVLEMDAVEMRETDGGFLLAATAVTLAVLYVAGTSAGLAQGHKFNGMP